MRTSYCMRHAFIFRQRAITLRTDLSSQLHTACQNVKLKNHHTSRCCDEQALKMHSSSKLCTVVDFSHSTNKYTPTNKILPNSNIFTFFRSDRPYFVARARTKRKISKHRARCSERRQIGSRCAASYNLIDIDIVIITSLHVVVF